MRAACELLPPLQREHVGHVAQGGCQHGRGSRLQHADADEAHKGGSLLPEHEVHALSIQAGDAVL